MPISAVHSRTMARPLGYRPLPGYRPLLGYRPLRGYSPLLGYRPLRGYSPLGKVIVCWEISGLPT
jgi:hypothetical protein